MTYKNLSFEIFLKIPKLKTNKILKNKLQCYKLYVIKREVKNMANVSWTKEQKQAIEEKGSNLLVAAAARKWKDSCFSRENYS